MSYYKEKHKAYIKLDEMLESYSESKTNVSIDKILLILTSRFQVSEKSLLERIYKIQKVYNEFQVIDGFIMWNEKEVHNNK